MSAPFVVVSDFDGTITQHDMVVALTCHVEAGNRALVDRINRRELDLKSGLTALFQTLPSRGRFAYETFLAESATFRSGYHQFQHVLADAKIPFYIVSNGLDFMLDAVLGPKTDKGPERITNHARFNGDHITIDWEHPCLPPCPGGCGLCKHKVVSELRDRHHAPVVFIGDGVTDVNGARLADRVFARSHLAQYLEESGTAYAPFDTFDDVLAGLFQSTEVKA